MSLRTLYQALLDSETARLRVIARLWHIPITTAERSDIAAELAASMAASQPARQVLESLPPDARAALDDLLRHEGVVAWATFARRWGEIRPVGPGRLEREALWEQPISPAETLWYHGFLYRAMMIDDQGLSREVAYIPADLMLYLPPPPPLRLPDPPATTPPPFVHEGDDALADRLAVLWGELLQHGARLHEGRLPAALRQHLLQRLGTGENLLDLLLILSEERGWLQQDERGLLRPSATEAVAWLRSRRGEQWAALFDAWRESRRWNDLAALPTLRLERKGHWPNEPIRTRQALLDLLGRLTGGVWYALDAFIAYVHEHLTDFLRPDGDYESWPLRDARTGAPLSGFDHWMEVEGAFLAHTILTTLHRLGVVDLGSRWEGMPPDRFRLNDAGTALLEGRIPSVEPPAPLERRADGTFVVPPGRRYELFQLHRIAENDGGALYRYRLTPASLGRARQQRISMERIITFLEESCGTPLPATFRVAIERAYYQGSEARLSRTWVLQSRDEALLSEESVRPLLRERLGRKAARLDGRDVAQLRRHLLALGILPDVEEP